MNSLLSFSSVKLELFSKDGTRLKSASGFALEAGNRYYLITNWHILAGNDNSASQLQEPAPKPHMLKTVIHSHAGEGEKRFPLSMGMRRRVTVPLYDDSGAPIWLEYHGSQGHQPHPDLVALPVRLDPTFRFTQPLRSFIPNGLENSIQGNYWARISAIPISAIDTPVEYGPSDTVHVIGYPHGWAPEGADRSSSAFWRTGFIASEIYEVGMSRSDVFFIDPCAPEGMTGSPVVGMKNERLTLLGVYSDSSTAEFGANAGLVYGAWLLKELIGSS